MRSDADDRRNRRALDAAVVLAVMALIALVYWPVHGGGFVWDDMLCFHDAAWLRHGDDWKHYIFRDFCDWTSYFRPLAVAVLTLQVRAFDSVPGPMHLVSLSMHLANTLLIGMLARRLSPAGERNRQWLCAALAALIYGLHPALVEPVFWVGCQYEMLLVFFTLLGLLLNQAVQSTPIRAVFVSLCFFLAACAKESAVAFPLFLPLLDLASAGTEGEWAKQFRLVGRRQWPVYLCVLVAGLAYLALRHWAIGSVAAPLAGDGLTWLARFQKAALAYVEYWKLLIWPMAGLSPIHPIDEALFFRVSIGTLAVDATAAAIAFGGCYAFFRRWPVGLFILAVSAALLPVLHIIPIGFNESLYHERYAMTAIAVGCSLLPATLVPAISAHPRGLLIASAACALWLILAIANIRITLPLWSDELLLWQWAVRDYPDSLVAQQHLLAKYVERHDREHASALADKLIATDKPCPVCMLEIAYFSLGEGDVTRASIAIERIKNATALPNDPLFLQEYITANGELLELQHDPQSAEEAYRDAIKLDGLDPRPRMNLAFLQLRRGDVTQARKTADGALPLYASDERARRSKAFDDALSAASTR